MPHTHDARAPRPSTAPSDAPIAPAPRPSTAPSRARIAWLLALSLLAGWFLFWPGVELARDLTDPALSGPGIPRRAVRVHRALTTPFAEWAEARVASGAAATAPLHDVPSTEWPMFSAVFYLMGARALGEAAARGEIEESALGDPPARAPSRRPGRCCSTPSTTAGFARTGARTTSTRRTSSSAPFSSAVSAPTSR